MSSIGHIFSNARRAMQASELGIQIAGHNIANANTPGYSRQRMDLVAAPGVRMPLGYIGNGVEIVGWDRVRDSLADATLRREIAVQQEFGQRLSTLRQVESAMSELGSAGVGEALSKFFDAWSSLAANPSGSAQREQVRQRGEVLVQRLTNVDSRVDTIESELESSLDGDFQRLNALAREVARLNDAIVTSEANGKSAPDLRDARDRSIDEMSGLVQLRASEQSDGSVTVISGNAVLVDRGGSTDLESFFTAGPGYQARQVDTGLTVRITGGKIGGAMGLLNEDLPQFRGDLDAVVAGLVAEVNTVHNAGMTLGGATGVDFFDPAGTTAGSIAMSAAVSASRDNVVAGYTGAYGDGDAANDLEKLRYTGLAAFGGDSITEAQMTVSVNLGLSIDNARDISEAQAALVENLDLQRQSVSGVSTEEEMVKLMQFQHAYQAAARVIRTADEMVQALLNM